MQYITHDEIFTLIDKEKKRQQDHIELIASENFVSQAVLEAQGSILTNKYAEGYPKKRYYGGCEHVDEVERLAIERACSLFGCSYANVQPHSGSQANAAVFLAMLQPGDCFLGMSLDAGGHLTHGAKVSMSGKWFTSIGYGVCPSTHLIDMDLVEELAQQYRPKLIIAGGSSYSRIIDFEHFRSIADKVNASLMVDMAHFSGLVAAKVYPSPFPYANVVTSTTHKTLRGPRGGLILTNDDHLIKKLDSAVFPGIQGGPLMHVIAAKAVCFREASTPAFTTYATQIVRNAKAMEDVFVQKNIHLIAKGSDTHLLLVDLKPHGITGKLLSSFLEWVGMVCNKNAIPGDPLPPSQTSGIRIGTPACTSRGFDEDAFSQIASMIVESINFLQSWNTIVEQDMLVDPDWNHLSKIDRPLYDIYKDFSQRVSKLCKKFPLY